MDNRYQMNSFLFFRMSWKETDEYDKTKETIMKFFQTRNNRKSYQFDLNEEKKNENLVIIIFDRKKIECIEYRRKWFRTYFRNY